MLTPDSPIESFGKIAKVNPKKLLKMQITTIRDLIFYYPFRYEDLSDIVSIDSLKINQTATVKGRVDLIANKRSKRKRMYVTEGLISDESGTIKVVWFNQPFIGKLLKVGDMVFVSGKVDNDYYTLQFTNPAYEKESKTRRVGTTLHTGRIVPVYPTTEGITSKQMRLLMQKTMQFVEEISEWVPDTALSANGLIGLHQALHNIHFPENKNILDKAVQRLKFDELFAIALYTQVLRNNLKKQQSNPIKFYEEETRSFVNKLPFKLTDAQKKCAWEILTNMQDNKSPMNRLLEGDVGAGKTVVAALAFLNVFLNEKKSMLMAPTEILAEQHYRSFSKFFKDSGMRIGLFTRNFIKYFDTKVNEDVKLKKKEMLEKIKENEIDIIIGTHALLSEKAKYDKIALIVVDEQHRFGVKQRQMVKEKGSAFQVWPHFLSMTATPIPRSLALSLYGDLDISILDQMPFGRKKTETRLVDNKDRQKAYDFIRQEIQNGRQCFIICPLIEESDVLGVKSVDLEYEKLKKDIFFDLKIGKLHGKMKKDEKAEIMADFSQNKLNILVSTSVVEVGVDIPNASIMMIEGSQRFGLAQLHQFRGRVGRSDFQSYCFLFTDSGSSDTLERLKYFSSCNNGFKLAEKDLEMRGPGEVYGVKQSGIGELKLARLTDYDLIKKAKKAAQSVLESDPDLIKYPLLRDRLKKFEQLNNLE